MTRSFFQPLCRILGAGINSIYTLTPCPSFPDDKQLRAFSWPGNVRQLKSTIKHLVLTVARRGGKQIRQEDLPEYIRISPLPQTPGPYRSDVLRKAILRVLGQMQILSVSDLVDRVGRNRHAISYQLEQMESEGLVWIERRRGRGGNIIHLALNSTHTKLA